MEEAVKLSKAQKKVIQMLRGGAQMQQCVFFNAPLKIKTAGDLFGKTVSAPTYVSLRDAGIIQKGEFKHPNQHYILTSLGATIDII